MIYVNMSDNFNSLDELTGGSGLGWSFWRVAGQFGYLPAGRQVWKCGNLEMGCGSPPSCRAVAETSALACCCG
jgi:hypothetical protein